MGLAIRGGAALSVFALEREVLQETVPHRDRFEEGFLSTSETTGHRDEVGPKVIFSLALLVARPQSHFAY